MHYEQKGTVLRKEQLRQKTNIILLKQETNPKARKVNEYKNEWTAYGTRFFNSIKQEYNNNTFLWELKYKKPEFRISKKYLSKSIKRTPDSFNDSVSRLLNLKQSQAGK